MGSVEEIEYFGHLLKGYEKGEATDGERRSEEMWKGDKWIHSISICRDLKEELTVYGE